MFREVDDGEVEMVVVMHVDDIFAHAKGQAMSERFGAELGNKLKLKYMSDTSFLEGPTLSNADELQTPEEKKEMLKFPYREVVEAFMWTAPMTRSDVACEVRAVARFCEKPELVHKKEALKVMQYLLQRKGWGITYDGQD